MSFTEVKIESETTQLLPRSETRGSSYREKISTVISWLGANYMSVLSILSTFIVILVLIEVMPKPSSEELENSYLMQLNPADTENDLILETYLGKVQAQTKVSRDGRNYYSFYKLPYAEPPVGRNRFKNPKPAEKWSGILNESQGGPKCKQNGDIKLDIAAGSEDCLYLNVHTPKFPNKDDSNGTLLPVMVYIYGGGFFTGDCNVYSPEYLMDEDIIFVAMNHRVGIFGFLNTEDGEIPGNLGFKDQVMALKWIQENIEAFGGDPNKVMLVGSSSGSVSTSTHMISPMSTGLFQRAVGISGVAIVPAVVVKDPLKVAQFVAEQVNCSTESTRKLVRCLRDADADILVVIDIPSDRFPSAFGITVDYIEDPNDLSEIFMPDLPYNLLQDGRINKVPYVTGNTESEQLKSSLDILKNSDLVDKLNNNWTQFAPSQFSWKSSAFNADSMSLKIREFYFGDKNIGNETWRNLTDLISDHTYIHPAYIAANWHAMHSPEDVHLYYFTKEVPKSYADSKKEGFPKRDHWGPNHGDELQFLYHYTDDRFPIITKDSANYNFSKKIIKMWVEFAETGTIRAPGVDSWDPISPDDKSTKWLRIDDKWEITDAILPRMEFWNQFSPQDLLYA